METESLVLGGGCFWCLEAVFEQVPGVLSVVPGYAGGNRPSPTYQQVCSGATGHAEVVEIRYDPAKVGRRELLELFFGTHDPTTADQQGPDQGPQYRSIILTSSEQAAAEAGELIGQLTREAVFPGPIVTEVRMLTRFWPAEPEHRGYFRRYPERDYCRLVISPKVARLRRLLAAKG